MVWKICKVEGTVTENVGSLPGYMSVAEVETTLQRLLCTRLTEQEVIAASHRKEMGGHSCLLERVGDGGLISFGQGEVRFIAEKKPNDAQCT